MKWPDKKDYKIISVLSISIFIFVFSFTMMKAVCSYGIQCFPDENTYVLRLPLTNQADQYKITIEELSEINDNAYVTMASGIYAQKAQIGNRTQFISTWVNYTDENLFELLHLELEQGSFLTDLDMADNAQVVVIDATLRDRLYSQKDVIGRVLTINDKAYTIVGVIEEDESILSKLAADGLGGVYIPATDQRYSMVIIRCARPYELIESFGSDGIMRKLDAYVKVNDYTRINSVSASCEILELLFFLVILTDMFASIFYFSSLFIKRCQDCRHPNMQALPARVWIRNMTLLSANILAVTVYLLFNPFQFDFLRNIVSGNEQLTFASVFNTALHHVQTFNQHIFLDGLQADRMVSMIQCFIGSLFGICLVVFFFTIVINNLALDKLNFYWYGVGIVVGFMLGLGASGLFQTALGISSLFHFPTLILILLFVRALYRVLTKPLP